MTAPTRPMEIADAFAAGDYEAQLNQCAFMLGAALVVSGHADRIPESGFLGVNRFALAEHECGELDDVIRSRLDADPAVVRSQIRESDLFHHHGQRLATRLQETADPNDALALMAAGTQSDHPIVRASAATAASMICGPDPLLAEVLAGVLAEAAAEAAAEAVAGVPAGAIGSDDPLATEVAATGLAHLVPNHPALQPLVESDPPPGEQRPLTNTVFITHGTWARRQRWWQPGGDFFDHIARDPGFELHDRSFAWSGSYRHSRREVAAIQLVAWVERQGLAEPDVVAHSHGGTVAHLSTHDDYGGQTYDQIILLSWPVHGQWFPDFGRVRRVFSVRVHFDLVIMADRGGQQFDPPPEHRHRVVEVARGYFNHSATHDPSYWDQHEIGDLIGRSTP